MELKKGDLVRHKNIDNYVFRVVDAARVVRLLTIEGDNQVGEYFHFFASDLIPIKPKCLTE